MSSIRLEGQMVENVNTMPSTSHENFQILSSMHVIQISIKTIENKSQALFGYNHKVLAVCGGIEESV